MKTLKTYSSSKKINHKRSLNHTSKEKTITFLNEVFNLIKKNNLSMIKFNLIFCDPPFKDTNIKKLIELIANKGLLKKNGIIILHRNKASKEDLPNSFDVLDERIYGVSKITFGKLLS